ncbi:MAG TPA: hypothetical protein VH500_17825 [Nitrososphaeraceae archaeon]|jgi:hypothetical protein
MKNNKITENYYNCDNNLDYDMIDNRQSGNINWWINELDSLGINKNSINNEKNNDKSEFSTSQRLENLADNIKQSFIHDYKTYYHG